MSSDNPLLCSLARNEWATFSFVAQKPLLTILHDNFFLLACSIAIAKSPFSKVHSPPVKTHDSTDGKSSTTWSIIDNISSNLSLLLFLGLHLKQQLWQDAVHLSVVTNAKDFGLYLF